MKVLLLTGPGGDAQGWGDMTVTRSVAEAIDASGYAAEVAFVETDAAFLALLDRLDAVREDRPVPTWPGYLDALAHVYALA